MKVAVMGSGNGALAVAFEWAQSGYEVRMFNFEQFTTVESVAARGGISADGELAGFQSIAYAGHDIDLAVAGTDLVFAVGPAYSTEAFGLACAPLVTPGQTFVVCPGSCAGAFVFKNALGLALDDESVAVAETHTLPYAVRITGDAHITVYNRLSGGYFVAAVPRQLTQSVFDLLKPVYPQIQMASSVLQTTLQNANPVIHPAVTLCNAALIERTGGDFLFYEEGVTDAVGRLIEAVDTERLAIGQALGVTVIRDPKLGIIQGYQAVNNYSTGYSQAPGFLGIKAQPELDHRYLNEDVGFGLVFMTDLASRLGVPTPNMDAVVQLCSTLTGRDFKAEQGRTMDNIGLSGYDLDQVRNL